MANQKIDFCINTPSDELLIRLIDSKTGEEVLEIPDTIQRELNQHTREYKNMAFEKIKR